MLEARRLLLLAILAASMEASLACSCSRPTPRDKLKTHALIFHGTVVEADQRAGIATFAVHKLYKGEVSGDRVTIRYNNGPSSTCGISLSTGEVRTVSALHQRTEQGDSFITGSCSLGWWDDMQRLAESYATQVATARRNVEADPSSKQLWQELVKVYESTNDHFPALGALEALYAISAGDPAIPTRIGETRLKVKRHSEALKAFDAALALDRTLEPAKRGRDQALLWLGRAAEVDPSRRQYSGMTLSKTDFSGRQLENADFSRARLYETRLDRARLVGAHFTQADIRLSSFAGAVLIGARFNGADTSRVTYADAELNGASFAGANLRMGVFSNADLRGSDFTGAKAHQANFSRAQMQGVKFRGASLSYADLSGVDLSGAELRGLELQGVVLRNATLVQADLSGARLTGALGYREERAMAYPGRAADLRGADLTGAKLTGTDLRYALFDCKTRWPAGFDPSALPLLPVTSGECPGPPTKTTLFVQPGELRGTPGSSGGENPKIWGPELENLDFAGTDFSGANLSGFRLWVNLTRAQLRATDLRNADLRNANLTGADLTGADLSGAQLAGADFSEAKLSEVRLKRAWFDSKTKWPAGFDPIAAGARSTNRDSY